MKDTDYVFCEKTPWGFLPEFVSEAWIDQVQRLTIHLELIKRPSATVCGVPQPIDLSTAIRIRCGVATSIITESFNGVSIQFVSSNKKTIVNTGSRYEDRIKWYQSFGFFLFRIFILSNLFRVNLESRKTKKKKFCVFGVLVCLLGFSLNLLSFLFCFLFIGFGIVNFRLGFITSHSIQFVSCFCLCSSRVQLVFFFFGFLGF